jgi:hypothetical protein
MSLICFVRFEAFPFIADELKHRPIRQLLELDTNHTALQNLIKPCLELNQFSRFCKILSNIRHKKWISKPATVDLELLEALFWNETDRGRAERIVALARFPTRDHEAVWTGGTNMLLSARTEEEKECALFYLEVFDS